MKRTTIYLAPELELRLKQEVVRRGQPMAELVREAVEAYLSSDPVQGPPGAGAFASGKTDTAETAEALLAEPGFADGKAVAESYPPPAKQRRAARRRA